MRPESQFFSRSTSRQTRHVVGRIEFIEGEPRNRLEVYDLWRYLDELSEKIPGMADHFDRSAPGVHVSDTVDYDVVIRGELILELDDRKSVHLRRRSKRNPTPMDKSAA
jgi:hypothetical protein